MDPGKAKINIPVGHKYKVPKTFIDKRLLSFGDNCLEMP
jgi:hypothetical protein